MGPLAYNRYLMRAAQNVVPSDRVLAHVDKKFTSNGIQDG